MNFTEKNVLKRLLPFVSMIMISACAGLQKPDHATMLPDYVTFDCPGTVELPVGFSALFEEVLDESLLKSALGRPNEGKLCQGKVYQVKTGMSVTLYRAWNSTNEKSRLGQWWAFMQPEGKVADYRGDYEICYQWSPLDKMTQCTFKAGSKVVIGTGQSAKCSEYLSYPASPTLQIYITDANSVSDSCQDFDGVFDWVLVEPLIAAE